MRHIKKLTVALLLLVLAFTITACRSANKVEDETAKSYASDELVATGTCGSDIEWELMGDGTLTLIGTDRMANFHNGNPWYEYRTLIKKVVLDERIISIGEFAFYECSELTDIELHEGIEYIGQYAFADCKSLKDIQIPESVDSIGDSTFLGCDKLESFVFPYKIKCISTRLFVRCISLKDVTIGSGVAEIEDNAFFGCTALETITIPENVKWIEDEVFDECTNLRNIYIKKERGSIDFPHNGTYWGAPSNCKVHWEG